MRISRCSVLLIAVLVVGAACPTARADWPNFRGPKHDGISNEKGLRTVWTEPIPLLWERSVGSAYSSFACVGDRVYTCGTADKRQVLYCLEADTGKVVWKNAFAEEYRDSQGDGTRATPTVDDGRIYILGALGKLLCANATTGKEIWSRQFHHKPKWGYSGSVLIEGDLAIASAGNDEGALIALNKKTGEPVWVSGDDPVGYATPYPFTFNDRRYVVGFMSNSAIIADAKTGKQVWTMPWKTDWDVNAASPIYHDGHLLLTSGYKTGCALLKLEADGNDLASETVWKSKVLLNKFQSCILHDGKLYTSDQRALKCVDFMTGEEIWSERRVKHGTLVLADGHLFLLTQEGQLQIGKVSPEGFIALTSAEILTGRCWTVPVLHRGRLYARNLDQRVVCYNLRQ